MKLLQYITVILFCAVAVSAGCSNPYVNPQTSKAVSERDQLEEMKTQTLLLQEQNKQLKRIADAMGSVTDSVIPFKQPHK
jgi:hypothetical protein